MRISVGGLLSWWQLETQATEAAEHFLTQNTSAAMIHPARIEELSKRASYDCQTRHLKLFCFRQKDLT